MKPVVGVMPLWDETKDSIWMLPGYMDGILQAGGLPVVFPFTENEQELEQLVNLCDGFLFTGGHDIAPELYHEDPLPELGITCPKRDIMEKVVLKKALDADKPVLGICRGIQIINAVLGGTLYQDIPTQHPSETEHHQTEPYENPVHEVKIIAGTPMHQCLAKDCLAVNSLHHQAVRQLAPVLEAMAVSPDGLVEAVYMPEKKFLWAVQWHPEFSYKTDDQSRRIFRAFVESMELVE